MLLFATPPAARATRPVGPHRETIAQRLARAATPEDLAVRTLLENWFVHLPEPARSDIRSRFWERDRRLSLAAFWELYLHELLRRLGYQLMVHPATRESGPRPDFLAIRNSEAFFVEALIHAHSSEAWRAERRLYPILDVLHDVRSAGRTLRIVRAECGQGTPPLRELREALRAWLDRLSQADAVPPQFVWRRGGWALVFEALPAESDAPGNGLSLVPTPPHAPTARALTAKLRAKARRYRALRFPLVLALCSSESIPLETLTAALRSLGTDLPTPVSGCLVAVGLDPWTIARTPLHLFTPDPQHPVPAGLVDTLARAGSAVQVPGYLRIESPWALFGLSPAWPGEAPALHRERTAEAVSAGAADTGVGPPPCDAS
ncbi:MAG: hypothetical protein RMK01_07130 [Thermomicrobium sp.]|nr:hypothetical protein [Thermomicrobium sp.]MDW8059831.1 hypothetical protein [Thermomicrobium sp.]